MTYCFRIRMIVPKRTKIGSDEKELVLSDANGVRIVLRSKSDGETIRKAHEWVLHGNGFENAEDAAAAAITRFVRTVPCYS